MALTERKGDPNIADDGNQTVLDKLDKNSTKSIQDWLVEEHGGKPFGKRHFNPGLRGGKRKY